jgi:chromosomal replication initiation ATPase DnaA
MEKINKLQNILKDLIFNLKKQDFLVYFRKISIIDISDTSVIFGVVSSFMRDNLQAKFINQILASTIKEIPNIKDINFKVDSNIDNPSNNDVVDCAKFYKEVSKIKKSSKTVITSNYESHTPNTYVCERYNLGNFVVGSDNQLAFSASEAVCKNP